MKSDPSGWVIVHPDGHFELDYFHCKSFKSKLDGYKEEIGIDKWMELYRPECRAVRMKLVPEVPSKKVNVFR